MVFCLFSASSILGLIFLREKSKPKEFASKLSVWATADVQFHWHTHANNLKFVFKFFSGLVTLCSLHATFSAAVMTEIKFKKKKQETGFHSVLLYHLNTFNCLYYIFFRAVWVALPGLSPNHRRNIPLCIFWTKLSWKTHSREHCEAHCGMACSLVSGKLIHWQGSVAQHSLIIPHSVNRHSWLCSSQLSMYDLCILLILNTNEKLAAKQGVLLNHDRIV